MFSLKIPKQNIVCGMSRKKYCGEEIAEFTVFSVSRASIEMYKWMYNIGPIQENAKNWREHKKNYNDTLQRSKSG